MTSLDTVNLDALAEVHHLILFELEAAVPTKMLQLNKTYLDKLLPSMNETVSLNEDNVKDFLYGLSDGFEVIDGMLKEKKGMYKITALRLVKNLRFDDLTAELEFCVVHQQLCQMIDGVDDDGEEGNTTREKIPILLPGVTHLHYSAKCTDQEVSMLKNYRDGDRDQALFNSPVLMGRHITPKPLIVEMTDRPSWSRDRHWYEQFVDYRVENLASNPPLPVSITVYSDIKNPVIPRITLKRTASDVSEGFYFIRFTYSRTDNGPDTSKMVAGAIWEHYRATLGDDRLYKPTYFIRDEDGESLIEELKKDRATSVRNCITDDDMVEIEGMICNDSEIDSSCPCVELSRMMK